MPKLFGKVDSNWFTVKRLGKPSEAKDGWKGFSGEILTIVPILAAFLRLVVQPMGVLQRNIECFLMLERLLKLFSLGAESAMPHVDLIERLIAEHAGLFKELYGDVIKPKFHHVYHIADHMRNLGRLLSCFVTERKHRTMKRTADHSFRNFETNLARDLLNLTIERYSGSDCMFLPEHLISPKVLPVDSVRVCAYLPQNLVRELLVSSRAVLKCGSISKGDIVMLSDRAVGRVECFAATKLDGEERIMCLLHRMQRNSAGLYQQPSEAIVVPSGDVLGALMWCADGEHVRVIPPPASAAW